MEALSVVIITYNEERNIERCIRSVVGIADEIVVVDSFSTDRTREIAGEFGAKVIKHEFEGYVQQKNYALAQATHRWVLSLDDDEALSEKLRNSIKEIKFNPSADGYTMNRLTNYCGKWIRHSGWYPDKKLRMVLKKKAYWTGTNPHDKLELFESKNIRHIPGDILHYSYYSLEDHLQQIDRFMQIRAYELFEKRIKPNVWHFYLKPLHKFFKHYFFQLGFMDGYEGYQIARLSAFGIFIRYAKLRELWRTNNP